MKKENRYEQRNEIEKKINIEVGKNRDFLKKLQQDPHKALKEKFGVDLPHHIKVIIQIEEPNTWHLVIKQGAISSQLSEQDLKELAAGDCWI